MHICMYDMGFGESILLSNSHLPLDISSNISENKQCDTLGSTTMPNSHDSECLLIDCGSESIDASTRFDSIYSVLTKHCRKSALISHFHNDHINGFINFSTKPSMCPKFDTVYIPNIFTYNHPNHIDLEIVKYILELYLLRSGTLCVWDLLQSLVNTTSNIVFLQRGDTFHVCSNKFETLWPLPNLDVFRIFENAIKYTSLSQNSISSIFSISDEITEQYLSFNNSQDLQQYHKTLEGLKPKISELTNIAATLRDLEPSRVNTLIHSLKRKANETSIVCQSKYNNTPLLLTGDISSSILKKIETNQFIPDIPMYEMYYFIKAPHHGTKAYYYDFHVPFNILGISNGLTLHPNRGRICCDYIVNQINYTVYCTNSGVFRCNNMVADCISYGNHCKCMPTTLKEEFVLL